MTLLKEVGEYVQTLDAWVSWNAKDVVERSNLLQAAWILGDHLRRLPDFCEARCKWMR